MMGLVAADLQLDEQVTGSGDELKQKNSLVMAGGQVRNSRSETT